MLPTLHNESDSRPRFEYYPANSATLRTVFVEHTPFTIGRGEHTELQINCASVSREHARLERTAGGRRLRDLGSTNGTWINGKAITDQVLHDGDSVRIADVELTFACSSLGRLQRMATQPLAAKPGQTKAGGPSARLGAVRSLGEALLCVSVPLRREELIDLRFGATLASRVSVDEPHATLLSSSDSQEAGSTACRYQDLAWQLAAQRIKADQPPGRTLLRLEQPTRLSGECLIGFQEALLLAPESASLGVSLAWEWVNDSLEALRTCGGLRQLGACLAYEDFSGGAKCVEALEPCLPDYLVLAPEVVGGVATNQRRWQRLEIVQAACEGAGVLLVLPGGVAPADSQTCQALGVTCGVRGQHEVAPAPAEPAPAMS